MKIIQNINEVEESHIALTIGNFDGVHLGHQYVIDSIKKQLSSTEALVVVTFKPHPIEVIAPKENFLINNEFDKYKMLSDLKVDYVLEIEFTRDLSDLSGYEFLTKYFDTKKSNVKFFLGYDFSFGANKKDGPDIVEKYCKEKGFKYFVLERKEKSAFSISSSEIRKYLSNGDIKKANKMLGRDFFITGTIVKGAGRGRQIGFPTANFQYPPNRIIPETGVYSTSVIYKNGLYKSVTNIGYKPTFETDSALTVETYILDFDQDIYGEKFELYFHENIRSEIKFKSVNDLIEQIKIDVELRKKND